MKYYINAHTDATDAAELPAKHGGETIELKLATADVVENQAASTAADVAGLVTDFNALLTKLKAAGIMAPDAEEEEEV
jgi:hypothetical protein